MARIPIRVLERLRVQDLVRDESIFIVAEAIDAKNKNHLADIDQELPAKDFLQFGRVCEQLAENGNYPNETKFRQLKGSDGIHEIKTSAFRIFAFRHKNAWFLTHYEKKSLLTETKRYANHITKAQRIRRQLLDRIHDWEK